MQALDVIFRDDCHHSIAGAAFVASIVAEALERCIVAQGTTGFQADRPPAQLLPPVMDAAHWTGGQGARASMDSPSTSSHHTLSRPRLARLCGSHIASIGGVAHHLAYSLDGAPR